jgi:hypothetical protein
MTNTPESRTPTGEIIDQSKPVESVADKVEAEPAKEPIAGPPEKYDFKAVEGKALDSDAITAATPVFKELGLTQDQAQKLVDLQSSLVQKAENAIVKRVSDMREAWRADVAKAFPNIDQTKADIGRMFSQLPQDIVTDLKSAMDLTGAGDHPAFVKAFHKLSEFFKEGSFVSGRGPSPAGQSANGSVPRPTAAQALYPNLPSAAS